MILRSPATPSHTQRRNVQTRGYPKPLAWTRAYQSVVSASPAAALGVAQVIAVRLLRLILAVRRACVTSPSALPDVADDLMGARCEVRVLLRGRVRLVAQ